MEPMKLMKVALSPKALFVLAAFALLAAYQIGRAHV